MRDESNYRQQYEMLIMIFFDDRKLFCSGLLGMTHLETQNREILLISCRSPTEILTNIRY